MSQTNINTTQPVNKPKWNSILKNDDNNEKMLKTGPHPEIQTNHRNRSESVPGITMTLVPSASKGSSAEPANTNGSLLLSPLGTNELNKLLDITFWEHNDKTAQSPMSPVRTPVVADWKIVGSPITPGSQNNIENIISPDISSSGFETLNDSPGKRSVVRKRAMSYGGFGTGFLPSFDSELLKDSYVREKYTTAGADATPTTTPVACEDNSEKGNGQNIKEETPPGPAPPKEAILFEDLTRQLSQVAQLPQALHEDIGVKSTDEATEIFKRSSMDSFDIRIDNEMEDNSAKPLRPMPSLFGRMPFGPAITIFGSESVPTPSTPSNIINVEEPGKASEPISRRHSSIFALPEWISSSSELRGDSNSEVDEDNEFSLDEYFMSASSLAKLGLGRRHSRRHSVALTGFFPEVEEQFGSLCLSSHPEPTTSSLRPSAASFNFKGPYDSRSPSSLNDFNDDHCFPNISATSLRDVSFQLSTYKGPLYAVEFKAGRTEMFYILEIDGKPQLKIRVGDLVIVEADRGEDLGKVTMEISVSKLKQLMMPTPKDSIDKDGDILTPELTALVHSKEIVPKRIHRPAQPADLKLLQAKAQEEAIAMVRCQSRIRQKKLPMEVVDAEYQWDRNKLTFYFCADRRIDFRELVRDLFRIYKTRIWMCAVDKNSPRMLTYSTGGTAGSVSTSNSNDSMGSSCYIMTSSSVPLL